MSTIYIVSKNTYIKEEKVLDFMEDHTYKITSTNDEGCITYNVYKDGELLDTYFTSGRGDGLWVGEDLITGKQILGTCQFVVLSNKNRIRTFANWFFKKEAKYYSDMNSPVTGYEWYLDQKEK